MGKETDLEIAQAIADQIEEVTLPELEETRKALEKTLAWIKEVIKEKRALEFVENLKLPGDQPR